MYSIGYIWFYLKNINPKKRVYNWLYLGLISSERSKHSNLRFCYLLSNTYICIIQILNDMDERNLICLTCVHFEKPNGYGCRAFPEGIPYGYPPNNKHDKPIKGQTGNYVYTPVEEKKK